MALPRRRKIFNKLKNKYRLVIMNDDTFEEKTSWKLTPLNVFVSVGIFLISFTFLLTYVIAFTPLREYIPGYADVNMQRRVRALSEQVEDIKGALEANDLYIANMKAVISGKIKGEKIQKVQAPVSRYDSLRNLKSLSRSIEDSLLRDEVEAEVPETEKK